MKYLLVLFAFICSKLSWNKQPGTLTSVSANHDFVVGRNKSGNAYISINSLNAGELHWIKLKGKFSQISASVGRNWNGSGDVFGLSPSGGFYVFRGKEIYANKHKLHSLKYKPLNNEGGFRLISAGFDSIWSLGKKDKKLRNCKFPCNGTWDNISMEGISGKIKEIAVGYKFGWVLTTSGSVYKSDYPFNTGFAYVGKLKGAKHISASKINDYIYLTKKNGEIYSCINECKGNWKLESGGMVVTTPLCTNELFGANKYHKIYRTSNIRHLN